MTWLFVDGYNIIGVWPELAALRDENLAEARRVLREHLIEYAATSQHRVVLIFDGYKVKGSRGHREDGRYLTEIYTAEGVSADMAIERLVAMLPKHEEVYVASSDRLVQEIILGQGGLRISAHELIVLVKQEKTTVRKCLKARHCQSPLDDRLDAKTRAQLEAIIFDEKNF